MPPVELGSGPRPGYSVSFNTLFRSIRFGETRDWVYSGLVGHAVGCLGAWPVVLAAGLFVFPFYYLDYDAEADDESITMNGKKGETPG